jgi:hypothetical protein
MTVRFTSSRIPISAWESAASARMLSTARSRVSRPDGSAARVYCSARSDARCTRYPVYPASRGSTWMPSAGAAVRDVVPVPPAAVPVRKAVTGT